MEIVLDTNFILTCVKQKIDFADVAGQVVGEAVKWIVPQQVLNELGQLKDREGMSGADKRAAELAFEILKGLDASVVDLGRNPNVDIGIVNYVLGTDKAVATLDKGLKERLEGNKILTIRGKDWLELI
jgi:rRNA-processing protein FCF1